MEPLDITVIAVYFVLLLAIGVFFSNKMKSSSDMFAAGRQSPWWLSGISAYMTMFSAGTFVVWGGIAYDHGFVAITIALCNGVGAFFAGMFFAGKWRKLGLNSAAEFINLRFGKAAFHFFTWFKIFMVIMYGLTLYALAVMLCPLIPLGEGNLLVDSATGCLSVDWACLILGVIIVTYTVCGGLWAVLITDTLQFFVLLLAVAMVVPLILQKVGGLGEFTALAPEGFLRPTAPGYSWYFIVGWVFTAMFGLGGEWAFIQRYLCVPTPRDAKKACYLFCGLYMTTPFLWMLPPMIYRVIAPDADAEQAYILACKEVLPAGMIGLMIVAMFSATASTISAMLNVFAGVITDSFYSNLIRPKASKRGLVAAGRIFTVVLGIWMMAGAIILPRLASYRIIAIMYASVIGPSLFLPTIWALWSKRISKSAIWWTLIFSIVCGVMVKFGFGENGFLASIAGFSWLTALIQNHPREADLSIGIFVPLFVLAFFELSSRKTSPEWQNLQNAVDKYSKMEVPALVTNLPAKVMVASLALLAVLMGGMSFFSDQKNVFISASIMLLFCSAIFMAIIYFTSRKNDKKLIDDKPDDENK